MPRFFLIRSMMLAVLLVTCAHLSAQAPQEAEDIRPAKEVVVVPKTLVETIKEEKSTIGLWLLVGGGVIFLVIALVIWRRTALQRRLNNSRRIALLSLAELEANQDAMGAEAFAYIAAKTLREYIAARFDLPAPRRTTEEFLRDVEKSPLIGESDHLRAFLKSCDLAKFAGSNLDSTQRGELLQTARGFVNATAKPQVVQP